MNEQEVAEREDQEVRLMVECLKNWLHETLMDTLHDFTQNY